MSDTITPEGAASTANTSLPENHETPAPVSRQRLVDAIAEKDSRRLHEMQDGVELGDRAVVLTDLQLGLILESVANSPILNEINTYPDISIGEPSLLLQQAAFISDGSGFSDAWLSECVEFIFCSGDAVPRMVAIAEKRDDANMIAAAVVLARGYDYRNRQHGLINDTMLELLNTERASVRFVGELFLHINNSRDSVSSAFNTKFCEALESSESEEEATHLIRVLATKTPESVGRLRDNIALPIVDSLRGTTNHQLQCVCLNTLHKLNRYPTVVDLLNTLDIPTDAAVLAYLAGLADPIPSIRTDSARALLDLANNASPTEQVSVVAQLAMGVKSQNLRVSTVCARLLDKLSKIVCETDPSVVITTLTDESESWLRNAKPLGAFERRERRIRNGFDELAETWLRELAYANADNLNDDVKHKSVLGAFRSIDESWVVREEGATRNRFEALIEMANDKRL